MKKIAFILLSAILFHSCSQNNIKEENFLEFLNETQKEFDKTKFELVTIKVIDTIFITNQSTLQNFENYNQKQGSATDVIDTTVMDYNFDKPVFIDWKYQPFSELLFTSIVKDGTNYVDRYEVPNKFLNDIVKSESKQFKNLLFENEGFKRNLIENLQQYEGFGNISNLDSLNKYIEEEKRQDKIIYGMRNSIKYRVNGILFERYIVFDINNVILEYLPLDND